MRPIRHRLAVAAVAAFAVGTLAPSPPALGQTAKKPPARERPKKRPPGVRGMFDAAQELYDAGKYPEALAAFGALLRKYPAHEPAAIQVAKTLYRMDRIKDAFTAFSHINPQHLDAETSYEYGWSFYTNKQWEGALYAFQRVPKGHALYDLANYYGAICAIKLKKYDDAEDMLEKAVVLPDKLAKSRALYIKHVQALQLMQQKSSLAKERDKEKDVLAESNKKKPKKDAASDPKTDDKGGYKHQGFKSVSKSAKVKYTYEHQYFDNNGLAEQNYDAKVSSLDLVSGPILPLPFKIKDHQAAFGLQLSFGAEDRIEHGTQQRVIADETNEDLARQLNSDLGTTDLKSGKVDAEAWLEFPLPENLWIAIGGEINFLYVDFERSQRSGFRKGYADLNGHAGALDYGAEGSYTEILDVKTKPTITIVNGNVYTSGDVAQKLTLNAKVSYDMYDYLAEATNQGYQVLPTDGPDQVVGVEAGAAQGLPFGAKFALLGTYQYQTNYIVHGLPTFGQVAADAQVYTGKATLSATPFPFVTASISQLIQKTQWKLQNEATRDSFEANVPDYIEDFIASIALNMTF